MTSIYAELDRTLTTKGPLQTADLLCETLRERKDYHAYFYALLLRKRLELGLPALQLTNPESLPKDKVGAYEEGIREAARTVGKLFLDDNNIPGAWPFYRMINETGPVVEAIAGAAPEDAEICQQVVGIALHEGLLPKKGFDLVLDRNGICSAITTISQAPQLNPEDKEYCIRRLVRALHAELVERVTPDIVAKEGPVPPGVTIAQLIAGRDWLFDEGFYHIDVSHLNAVVQLSMHLQPSEELDLAIELCEYGMMLASHLQGTGDPPFEDNYSDYRVYLRTLAGREVEEGLAHFRSKIESMKLDEVGSYPAEVFVNLLYRTKRYQEAAEVSARHLTRVDPRYLNCPSLQDLCQLAGDYEPLRQAAAQRDNLVDYAAGLIEGRGRK